MIFISTRSTNFSFWLLQNWSARAHQKCQYGHTLRTHVQKCDYSTCALAQTAPLLSKPCDHGIFLKTVLAACRFIPRHFDWRFCWSKGTSLECAKSIYVKTIETACVSEELCCLKEEIVGQNGEFRQFSYKACLESFSYFKHTNS